MREAMKKLANSIARRPRENGYIVWENDEIVCIATGFQNSSANSKTGGMIQTWFLAKETNPADAVSRGIDSKVCFDCPFANGNGCYVAIGKAPMGIYRKWQNGLMMNAWETLLGLPTSHSIGYQNLVDLSLVVGRKFRFGSYGEPILLPIEIVKAIASASNGWTGYTHQWRNPSNLKYRDYFRASTSDNDDAIAQSYGWKTFCVSDREIPNSIVCPASHEAIAIAAARHAWQSLYGATKQWKQASCEDCGMCSGNVRKTSRGIVANVAPNVRIKSHGWKANKARKAIADQFAAAA